MSAEAALPRAAHAAGAIAVAAAEMESMGGRMEGMGGLMEGMEGMDDPPSPADEPPFCFGNGVSMHMGGFRSLGGEAQRCLVYLFVGWRLGDGGQFALALLATAALGVMSEYISWMRNRLHSSVKSPIARWVRARPKLWRLSMALTFAMQVAIGYLLMLVAMSYQVCVCTSLHTRQTPAITPLCPLPRTPQPLKVLTHTQILISNPKVPQAKELRTQQGPTKSNKKLNVASVR